MGQTGASDFTSLVFIVSFFVSGAVESLIKDHPSERQRTETHRAIIWELDIHVQCQR